MSRFDQALGHYGTGLRSGTEASREVFGTHIDALAQRLERLHGEENYSIYQSGGCCWATARVRGMFCGGALWLKDEPDRCRAVEKELLQRAGEAQIAHNQGSRAFTASMGLGCNPYDTGHAWHAWRKGWQDAMMDPALHPGYALRVSDPTSWEGCTAGTRPKIPTIPVVFSSCSRPRPPTALLFLPTTERLEFRPIKPSNLLGEDDNEILRRLRRPVFYR